MYTKGIQIDLQSRFKKRLKAALEAEPAISDCSEIQRRKITRWLRTFLFLGYLILVGFGFVQFLKFLGKDNPFSDLFAIHHVQIEVQPVHGSQPLDIANLLVRIKKDFQALSYFEARKLIRQSLTQEDWLSQTWSSFHYPHKLRITLIPKYIWGYVYVQKEKRFYPLTLDGNLLKTAVVPSKLSQVDNHLYGEGNATPSSSVLQQIQQQYDDLNQMLSKFSLKISQYLFGSANEGMVVLSNGLYLISPELFSSKHLSKIEQVLSFLDQRIPDINSIQFISSKKVVVSFRH